MTRTILHTPSSWEAWPKNDRLRRWCVVSMQGTGRGKAVIADVPVHGSTPSVAANRLNHIFGKAEHALDDLVTRFGSQDKAYAAVQRAADAALAEGKLIPGRNGVLPSGDAGIIIDVAGTPVRLIGGRVKDGAVQLSSFSRKGP